MYIKNTGKLFQVIQVGGVYLVNVPKRGYSSMAQPQAYLTKNYNQALEQLSKHGLVSPYYKTFLNLNNFEIIEYEITEKYRHKHPLVGR